MSERTKISEEAVELAAKELLRIVRPSHPNWEEWTEDGQEMFKSQALLILQAVAPSMIREAQEVAWDEGATAGWESSGEGWNGEYPGHAYANDIPNPYGETA